MLKQTFLPKHLHIHIGPNIWKSASEREREGERERERERERMI